MAQNSTAQAPTFIGQFENWSTIAVLVVLYFLLTAAFQERDEYLGYQSPDSEIFNLKTLSIWDSATLHQRIGAFGPEGRRVYAITELTLDLLFPLVYTALFWLLLGKFYPSMIARLGQWIAVVALVADYSENLLLAYSAITYGAEEPGHYLLIVFANVTKWVSVLIVSLAILVGGIAAFFRCPCEEKIESR